MTPVRMPSNPPPPKKRNVLSVGYSSRLIMFYLPLGKCKRSAAFPSFQNCILSPELNFHGDQFSAFSGCLKHISHISVDVFTKIESVIESNENFVSEQFFNLHCAGLKSRGDYTKMCCLYCHKYIGLCSITQVYGELLCYFV